MNKNIKMIKKSILSVALLTVMAGAAISPAVGSIAKNFANAGPILIKLIVTLPALMVIPFSLIAGRLSDSFGKRKVLLIGVILYFIGGIGGGFTETIETLLICRALLGLSVGLIMPVSMALVSDFFKDDEATQMMGWISASNHLGGMIAQIISGALAALCWRYSFSSYALAFFVFMMVFKYLPEPEKKKKCIMESGIKLPVTVYLCAGSAFMLMLVFYTIPVNISLFIERNGMGNAVSSGAACAMITGSAFFAGIGFQKIKKYLNSFAVPIGIVIMTMGFGILHLASGIIPVFIGVAFVGFGEGYLLPYIFHLTRMSVDINQSVKAMSIVTSMIYLGQFSSPIIIDSITNLLPPIFQESPFFLVCCLSMGATIISINKYLFINKKTKKHLIQEKI